MGHRVRARDDDPHSYRLRNGADTDLAMTNSRRHVRASRNHAHGQELVEFALVLPLLFLVAFGVLDLGRLFHAAITINNAAREGARYATRNPEDLDGVVNAAMLEAQNSGVTLIPGNISWICPDPSGCGSGLPLRVIVRHDFQLLLLMVFPDPNMQLVRSAEMMIP